jgi:hypothetical protein
MINGIKPSITTKTKVGSTNTYDEAMDNFLAKLTENGKEYIKRYRLIDDVVFKTDGGRKYIKVKYYETKVNNEYHEDGTKTTSLVKDTRGSIHCFVDSKTGDIYKPAGWRAPYTKGNNCVRGNIYDASTYQKTDLHGGWLYAR